MSCVSHREHLLSWLFPKWVTGCRVRVRQPGRFRELSTRTGQPASQAGPLHTLWDMEPCSD